MATTRYSKFVEGEDGDVLVRLVIVGDTEDVDAVADGRIFIQNVGSYDGGDLDLDLPLWLAARWRDALTEALRQVPPEALVDPDDMVVIKVP